MGTVTVTTSPRLLHAVLSPLLSPRTLPALLSCLAPLSSLTSRAIEGHLFTSPQRLIDTGMPTTSPQDKGKTAKKPKNKPEKTPPPETKIVTETKRTTETITVTASPDARAQMPEPTKTVDRPLSAEKQKPQKKEKQRAAKEIKEAEAQQGSMSTSKKHQDFMADPSGNKPATALPGIGDKLGERLKNNAGFDFAYLVLGQYLLLRKDEEKFKSWLGQDEYRANAEQQTECFNLIKEWCDLKSL